MPSKETDLAKIAEEMSRSEDEINAKPKTTYAKGGKTETKAAPKTAKVEVVPTAPTAEEAKKELAKTAKKTEEEVLKFSDAQLVKLFIETTKTATVVNEGEKAYPHAEAYQFLAYIKDTYPTIQEVTERVDEVNKNVKRVYARAALKSLTGEHETIATAMMVACTDEDWVKAKPNAYSVAYGLAQTRAITRVIRNQFGYIMAQAGFAETPYEELGDEKMDLECIYG